MTMHAKQFLLPAVMNERERSSKELAQTLSCADLMPHHHTTPINIEMFHDYLDIITDLAKPQQDEQENDNKSFHDHFLHLDLRVF